MAQIAGFGDLGHPGLSLGIAQISNTYLRMSMRRSLRKNCVNSVGASLVVGRNINDNRVWTVTPNRECDGANS